MSRILIHPGFHKTGTTSAQHFLYTNREVIWPHAALALPGRMQPVARYAAWYAAHREAPVLTFLRDEVAGFVRSLSMGPRRDLVMSSENLLGPMPHGTDRQPYPHAPDLIQALLEGVMEALETHPSPPEITLYLSLRGQSDWEASIWAHLVRKLGAVRMTTPLPRMRKALRRSHLRAETDRIAAVLPKGVRLITHDMSDLSDQPFGTAQPFVDFLSPRAIPREAWQPTPAQHHAPPRDVTNQLFALNRSDLDDDALIEAKRAVLEAAGQAARRHD